MNYLGHAFLSFGDPLLLTGNIAGDYIKGKIGLDKYPEKMQQGILLHRKIDTYTDAHLAVERAKIWFREDYRLYSGAIMDTIFDHFLANDPKHFPSEKDLLEFTLQTYAQLENNREYMPERFALYFPYMKEQNWLYNYRHVQGIQRSLNGLHRRAQHMPPPDNAYKTFITHYYQLAQCYYELIDDVISFVKIELSL